MWILPFFGPPIELFYNSAGALVDAAGQIYYSDASGQVSDAAGVYIGQLTGFVGDFVEDTRDLAVDAARDTAIAGVITAGLVVLTIFVVAKVL